MKNEFKNLIRLPIELGKIIWDFIADKFEFSIRFRLSLSYIRILLWSVIIGGLSVIAIFGAWTIYDKVSNDYLTVLDYIDDSPIAYGDIKNYSLEHGTQVLIYDQLQSLIYSTDQGLADQGYKRVVAIIPAENKIYLAINTTAIHPDLPVKTVIFSDVKQEIAEVIRIALIILIVFTIVIIFSIISITLVGRGFFQPLKEMTQTVKDISERNLNLRLNVSGSKNELKELAMTFNEMMNRIEDYYNRQKQFVSDASHELRTPIAVIQGYADMVDRWGKNDKEVLQESIEAIKNESENMKELIDKLLFLARHDKETFVLQKEEFSLSEMLQEIAKETQIIDSSHKVSYNITKEVTILADRNRIKQAIRIFIDNAIKYTPPDGEISINIGEEDDFLAIIIKDTGIGMTKEELRHIFDRFYRSEQSRSKEKGGHGLGLAIAKIIILSHGGKIKVKSKLGEGSEFIILLKESKIKEL